MITWVNSRTLTGSSFIFLNFFHEKRLYRNDHFWKKLRKSQCDLIKIREFTPVIIFRISQKMTSRLKMNVSKFLCFQPIFTSFRIFVKNFINHIQVDFVQIRKFTPVIFPRKLKLRPKNSNFEISRNSAQIQGSRIRTSQEDILILISINYLAI